MAYPESMSTDTSLADYSTSLPVDFESFIIDNNSSNYDQVFNSSQSTFYASNHSRSSSNNFENGSYPSDTSHLPQEQQKLRGQFQRSSGGNPDLVQDGMTTAQMGSASDDVNNWLEPRLASASNEELEQPKHDSFRLTQAGINSSSTDLSSWDSFEKEKVRNGPQQQRQLNAYNIGWSPLQHSNGNVNSMSPAGSAVMGSFSQTFHQTFHQGQSQQLQLSQEEMKSRSTSHSENSLSVASTEGGDIQQGAHRRKMSISSSVDPSQLSVLTTIQHQAGAVPASKNVSVGSLMDFENNLPAAKLRKTSPQQIPMKQQQHDREILHTRTNSWSDGSLTAESVMVSSSPSRLGSSGFQSSHLRDLSNSATPLSTAHSVLQQQQQQLVPQASGQEEYSNHQERGLLLVNLLVACADAVANNNQPQAMSLLNELSQMVSPHGDSIQRVASYFTYGLLAHIANTASGSSLYRTLRIKEPTAADTLDAIEVFSKVCPFMRFGEVAAIQAILEAFQGEEDVHWIHLGMAPGSLWLPCQLLQALATRNGGPPKMIHFTGVQVQTVSASDDKAGRQLKDFADNLHLNFIFQRVPIDRLEILKPWMLTPRQGQAVAVNCSAKLHTLLYDDGTMNCLNNVLAIVHNLGPKVFCILEQEATHNVPTFLARFLEALHFYSAIFDSLEATLSRVSPERAKIEQLLLGQEIINIVSREGNERVERHERFQHWRSRMTKAGFRQLPLSEATVTQVKAMRCISYGTGFTVLEELGSLILNWQDRPLFTSSAWST